MSDDKKLKEFRVIETCTIIREAYIEAESMEKAEEIVDSDLYMLDFEVTEEYTDNIEVWEEQYDTSRKDDINSILQRIQFIF